MSLKTFTGFRGIAGMFQVGEIRFMMVAPTIEQLQILHDGLLREAGPFNPDACQKSIVISSKLLPEPKNNNEPSHTTQQSPEA